MALKTLTIILNPPCLIHSAASTILTLGVRFTLKRLVRIIQPIVSDRLRHMEEFGDHWGDKPVSEALL